MKPFGVFLVLLAILADVRADAPALAQARQRLLRGNYAEAQEQYTELAKDDKHKAAATVGLSKTLQSIGEYDRALAVVDAALKDLPKNADLLARRAEVLYLRGRWVEAEKAAGQAIAQEGEHFQARWVKAQILRDRGDIPKADEEFRWFVRTYTARSNMDKDITDPDALLLCGLAGCERARWHNLSRQFDTILNEVWTDAIKKDKDFWPAEYESARLLQEKDNKLGAFRSYNKALAINPRSAEVIAGLGQAALQQLELKEAPASAEQYAHKALKINPRLTAALRLLADLHLFAGDITEAKKELAKARAVNPREELTLARLATCLFLERKGEELALLIKEVESHNAKPAVFFHALAASLEERRFYDEAEKYYQLSFKLQPQLPFAQNSMGLMYMRRGKEDEAKKVLEEAFKADPFNIRVGNTLKVLDHLAKYTTLKTEHFLLRYDPANDQVLANFMAKYLEEIYTELAGKFQYRPKGPILIEVFNKHEMFSGRVLALPDLHTIGACTGDLVAMVSPRDKSKKISKPFNWVRVLRHELVHVFNLEQTKYRVPHWFTEGLAVLLEGTPPPPNWNLLLAEKFLANDLLNLDTILLGFIRPRSADQWHQAYMQSLLYVEYLTKNHGDKVIGELLAAYRDGLDTAAAVEKVCKVSKAQFEKGYCAFLEERVKNSGILAAGHGQTFKELKAAHAKDPGNLDVAAQLADRYFQSGDKDQAKKLAEDVLAKNKMHPLAGYVRAHLHLFDKETDKAVALLEAVADGKPPQAKVFKLLAKVHFAAKKFPEAAKALERGRKLEPHVSAWIEQLAQVYLQTGDRAKLIDLLKDLVPADADDLVARRKLAELLAKEGRHAEAERYARMALEIDVLDGAAQQILENALTAQNKDKELRQLRKLLEK